MKHSNEQNLSSSSTSLSHSQRVSPSRPQTPRFFSLALNRYPSQTLTSLSRSQNRSSPTFSLNKSLSRPNNVKVWKKAHLCGESVAQVTTEPSPFASSNTDFLLILGLGFSVLEFFTSASNFFFLIRSLLLFISHELGFWFGTQRFNRENFQKCFLCSELGCPVWCYNPETVNLATHFSP